MAPALSDGSTHDKLFDNHGFVEKASHQRRALASVNNTHMEEDDMGLQSTPNLARESQEMDQMLVDLEGSDIVQADLLQAIKTLESAGLSTSDADAIFPLSGFDLPETFESESDATEEKIKVAQARIERRVAFLIRRLRIFQARTIGKRVSEEAAQVFEKALKTARSNGSGRPPSLKALLKKIETTSTLQASAAARSVAGPTYFNAGTSRGDATKSASIGVPSGAFSGLEDTAGALRSHLSVVKHEVDSDATLSSSGAESNDEFVVYNNPHQQLMPIEKRALWSWQKSRASIASRWYWLQAQIQELEYKIRQHTDLHKQVRSAKGPVEFEHEPKLAGYEGPLPGADLPDDDPVLENCARKRPLKRETFKKRKLLQMHNLHTATTKAAKPSDIVCVCIHPVESCAVCTGRPVPNEPLPPWSTLSNPQKLAHVDPGYHPVLSDIRDVSSSVHLTALCSRGWFRSRAVRGAHHGAPPRERPAKRHTTHATHTTTPHIARKRGRPPLTRKMRDDKEKKEKEPPASDIKDDDTPTPVTERPRPRASTESRHSRLNSSYDIDNIVIPQSIAANTRPEILHYKEIITPKWRVLEVPEMHLNNGNMLNHLSDSEEDVSEDVVAARHERALARERGKFVAQNKARRNHSNAELITQPPTQTVTLDYETVRPYSPRQFPLDARELSAMMSSSPSPLRRSVSPAASPLSPLSPAALDPEDPVEHDDPEDPVEHDDPEDPVEHDDPDDVEWDPTAEKGKERRRTGYR